MHPITRVIDKPMLPLGNLPAIHYVVREAIARGVQAIRVVKPRGSSQISDYFALREVRDELRKAAPENTIPPIEILDQDPDIPYGTAAPLLSVAKVRPLRGSRVMYMSADDILLDRGRSESSQWQKWPATIGAVRKNADDARPYGVIQVDGPRVIALDEKPDDVIPDKRVLVNCSRYIFNAERILDVLEDAQPDPRSGELRITDAIQQLILQGEHVACQIYDADHLDVGTPRSYREAVTQIAKWQFDPQF
jgi:UTP-glucose-1-phosphate uridylyltransferase